MKRQIAIHISFDEEKTKRMVDIIVSRRISKIIKKIFKEEGYANKIKQQVNQLCLDEFKEV